MPNEICFVRNTQTPAKWLNPSENKRKKIKSDPQVQTGETPNDKRETQVTPWIRAKDMNKLNAQVNPPIPYARKAAFASRPQTPIAPKH
jgi:hypothetical protein